MNEQVTVVPLWLMNFGMWVLDSYLGTIIFPWWWTTIELVQDMYCPQGGHLHTSFRKSNVSDAHAKEEVTLH